MNRINSARMWNRNKKTRYISNASSFHVNANDFLFFSVALCVLFTLMPVKSRLEMMNISHAFVSNVERGTMLYYMSTGNS